MASVVSILFASGMELDRASLTCFWQSRPLASTIFWMLLTLWGENIDESHVAKQLLPSTSIWCGNHCRHSQDDPKLPQIHPPGILMPFEFETIKIQSKSIKPHSTNVSIANFLVLWSSKSSVGCANMGYATTQLWSYWWGITSKVRITPGDHRA